MAFQLPNGSSLQLQKSLAAALPFTALSNATEGVATVVGATLKAGDIVVISTSTSTNLALQPLIVKSATATAITFLNFDTTDTSLYPVGTSGTIQKVETWVDLPLTSTIANSGGDANTTTVQFIQDEKARNLFTTTNPEVTTLTMAHDSTDAARADLVKYTRTQAFVVYKVMNPRAASGKGEIRLSTVQCQFNGNPVMAVNEVENVSLAMTIQKGANIYLKETVDALV